MRQFKRLLFSFTLVRRKFGRRASDRPERPDAGA